MLSTECRMYPPIKYVLSQIRITSSFNKKIKKIILMFNLQSEKWQFMNDNNA